MDPIAGGPLTAGLCDGYPVISGASDRLAVPARCRTETRNQDGSPLDLAAERATREPVDHRRRLADSNLRTGFAIVVYFAKFDAAFADDPCDLVDVDPGLVQSPGPVEHVTNHEIVRRFLLSLARLALPCMGAPLVEKCPDVV